MSKLLSWKSRAALDDNGNLQHETSRLSRRSSSSLELENFVLRHQLTVLRRRSPKRPVFSNFDRLIFICLYRIAPGILDALAIVEPETVVRWHRAGFRTFWVWITTMSGSDFR
jgi:hypothetical protein